MIFDFLVIYCKNDTPQVKWCYMVTFITFKRIFPFKLILWTSKQDNITRVLALENNKYGIHECVQNE